MGSTVIFDEPPVIESWASVAGNHEKKGPLGSYFDIAEEDTTFGHKTWEQSESAMQNMAFKTALEKTSFQADSIDYIFAGDLDNQCIASSFGLMSFNIPMVGLFGACSTMAEGIALSSLLLAGGAANHCAAVTSSHFCSAERQFRYPLEYGGQRPPTAQWTVTGAGATILSKSGQAVASGNPKIRAATIGRITQLGIKDINNMGGAMAPAAADTLTRFFQDTGKKPDDFDLIVTGDLGELGLSLTIQLLQAGGYDCSDRMNDCGCMVFDNKDKHYGSGGSGCGCSAIVLNSYILGQMLAGNLKNVLFIGTGALMSPTSTYQGEIIPAIAHLVHIGI